MITNRTGTFRDAPILVAVGAIAVGAALLMGACGSVLGDRGSPPPAPGVSPSAAPGAPPSPAPGASPGAVGTSRRGDTASAQDTPIPRSTPTAPSSASPSRDPRQRSAGGNRGARSGHRRQPVNRQPRGLTLNVARLDRTDADAVVAAFGILLDTSDTRIDRSATDSGTRAAALATPALATRLKRMAATGDADGSWTGLVAHDGYTAVTARLGGAGPNPADRPTSGARIVTVTVQRHGDHGWKPAPDRPQTLLVILHRADPKNPWSVSKYQYI